MQTLAEFDFLAIGLPIEVDVPSPETGLPSVYYCQIMDLTEEQILISVPQRKGLVAAGLSSEQNISLRFFLSDATYACDCQILDWQAQPPGLILGLPVRVERIQRRNFVRIDAELPVVLKWPAEQVAGGLEVQTSTLDLSGGGLMVLVDLSLPLQTLVEGKLYLPGEKESEFELLPFTAEVCRCEPQQNKFLMGLTYPDLAETLRDRLIRFIFRYQRESLQNRAHLII